MADGSVGEGEREPSQGGMRRRHHEEAQRRANRRPECREAACRASVLSAGLGVKLQQAIHVARKRCARLPKIDSVLCISVVIRIGDCMLDMKRLV